MKRKKFAERRKHKRYQAQEGAFAVVRPEFTKLGQIIDISHGGLAFRYCVTGPKANEALELDIFLTGDGFYLEKIPFETVTDRRMSKKFSHAYLPTRRCGVRFGELTRIQIAQLEYFIQNHATTKRLEISAI